MVTVTCVLCFLAFLGICLALPLPQEDHLDYFNNFRQNGGFLGAIGTALVPVFGAILSNLASGISTTFNNGIAASANANRPLANIINRPRPAFDAYMVHIPGSEAPYMLLTEQPVGKPQIFAPAQDGLLSTNLNDNANLNKLQLKAVVGQNPLNQQSSLQQQQQQQDSTTNLEPSDTSFDEELTFLDQTEI